MLNISISKVLFPFTIHGHSHWFVLRRKLSRAKGGAAAQTLIFLRETLAGLYVT